MKIFVNAKPNSKENKVTKMDENHFSVRVTAPPVEGKANQAVIELLAEYFHLPKSHVQLLSGQTSKSKVFEVTSLVTK